MENWHTTQDLLRRWSDIGEIATHEFANDINSLSRAIFFCAFFPVPQLSRQDGNSIRKEILLCDTCVATPKKPNE